MSHAKDPLAGKRQAINDGEVYSLIWPDTGDGCPVQVDQVFPLRSCRIVITKTHRIQKKQPWKHEDAELPAGWFWRAAFATYRGHVPPEFLGRNKTVSDSRQAMGAQDPTEPGTLRAIGEDERDPLAADRHAALGEQPEPEMVSKFDVPDLDGSREARQRYELEMAERRVKDAEAPLEQRLARLRDMARHRNVDISSEIRVIEKRIEVAEGKVLERAAA
jgi:hypothetical protein